MSTAKNKNQPLSQHQIMAISALWSFLAVQSHVVADDHPWVPIATMGLLCLTMIINLYNHFAERRALRRGE